MNEIKFKKGDRVRVISHPSNDDLIPLGSTGTVLEEDEMPWVSLDDKTLPLAPMYGFSEETGMVFLQEELELIEEVPGE